MIYLIVSLCCAAILKYFKYPIFNIILSLEAKCRTYLHHIHDGLRPYMEAHATM